MKKILIFNLTRLGDLLQSTPMLGALRKKYPDAHIALLANRTFSDICEYIPFIDAVYIFDIKRFKPALTGREISLVKVYRYLESLLDEMKNKRFDMIINLTHSKLSAMFSHLLNVPETVGMVATDYGDRQIKGLWISYFCNMVFNREFSRFNLVDIYTKAIGCKPEGRRLYLKLPEKINIYTEKFIASNNLSKSDFIVGFQPGSSRKDRRWQSGSFVQLSNKLQDTLDAKIVLFGTSAEEDIGEEIAGLTRGEIINTIGNTDISQLIGILKNIDILVTNDTGTMHIASALGVKVIALFFAHAWSFETGPYGEGHIIIQADISCSPCSHGVECKSMECKKYITPEDVFEIIRLIRLDEKNIKLRLNQDHEHFKQVKIMIPFYGKDEMYDCMPLKSCKVSDRDIIGMLYKEVWKLLLDNNPALDTSDAETDEYADNIVSCVSDRIKRYFLYDSTGNLFKVIKEDINSFKDLSNAAAEGIRASEEIIAEYGRQQKDIILIKKIGKRMSCIDERIEVIGTVISASRPLIQVFKFGKENQEGEDIYVLAKETKILYQRLYLGSSLMFKGLNSLRQKLS